MDEPRIHDLRKKFLGRQILTKLKRRAAEMNEGQKRVEIAVSELIMRASQLVAEHFVQTPEQFAAELGPKPSNADTLVLALLERAVTSHRDYMKETEIPDPLPGA